MAASKFVHQWFKKSAEDLRVAKAILNFDEKFYEYVCFHTQQSAEKAIKGFLTFHKVRFDKTHDIAVLTGLVKGVDANIAEKLRPADDLTKFAVRIRYPEEAGVQLVVDIKLATRAIKLAEDVISHLKHVLDE